MAVTGPEVAQTRAGIGPKNRPASGSNAAATTAGNRRTAGFADMFRAQARAAPAAPREAAAADTAARPDLPTEVATKIRAEAQAEAEAALAVSLRSGKMLETVIEAAVQAKLRPPGDNAGGGIAATEAASRPQDEEDGKRRLST